MNTTTAATKYTFKTGSPIRARYHDGRVKTALPVHVTNHENGKEYEVLVTESRLTCNCQGFTTHYRGTNKECVHCRGTREHLLREAAGRMLSPAILEQISPKETATEKDARVLRERETLWG